MERETGLEPATSSLGIHPYVGSKSIARFSHEFLNLRHLAESVSCKNIHPNEAQLRQGFKRRMKTSRRLFAREMRLRRERIALPSPPQPGRVSTASIFSSIFPAAGKPQAFRYQ